LASEMWAALQKELASTNPIHVLLLIKEWRAMEYHGGTITDYLMRFDAAISKLEGLGEVISDKDKRSTLILSIRDERLRQAMQAVFTMNTNYTDLVEHLKMNAATFQYDETRNDIDTGICAGTTIALAA